ncbi:MAG: glycosyl transferase group 1 [Phycisphaerales bacterium]|nr:glycosyl transferase group 1 [Phycisphaerales bacterium]
MKVLMTTDAVGGVWTYAMELARALRPAGVEIVLATMGPAMSAAQEREAAGLSNVTVCPSTWKLEWMNEPWADVAAAGRWLLKLEETHRPDVIHLNGYVHGALPWRAPVMVVGHSCVLSWWRAVKGEAAPAEWGRYEAEVRRGIRQADMLIAPSREMLRSLGQFYGPLPPGRVIYNAREPALFPPRRKRPLVLSAGRLWDEAKNVSALERVADELDWPVYVAGETRAPDGGRAHASATRMLGKLDQTAMSRWLGSASIYCLPARYEPFGLSVLEAALAGCALVLGDIPSLREVWGAAAIFVPPDDPTALRKELHNLIHNDALRADFSRRARDRAELYTPQRMVGTYLSVYRYLARAEASPPDTALAYGSTSSLKTPDYAYPSQGVRP